MAVKKYSVGVSENAHRMIYFEVDAVNAKHAERIVERLIAQGDFSNTIEEAWCDHDHEVCNADEVKE